MRRYFILAAILFSTSSYLFAQDVTSQFDTDDEDWRAVQNTQTVPTYHSTGGNPGGYISVTDNRSGITWYWHAPEKFLGDVSSAYGGSLSFDLRQSLTANQFNGIDVILEGNGLTLVYNTPNNPGTAWTSYSVALIETAGWTKTSLTGPPPTQAEMLSVLSSLTKLEIRGEYSSSTSGDRGDLDNVVLAFNSVIADAGPDQTINSGESVTLGGAPTASGGTAPYTYSWSPANGLDNPSIANPTASPAYTTIYTVTVTDADNVTGVDVVVVMVNGYTQQCITSFFDSDNDGWIIAGDAQGGTATPDYFASGGNPGGYVSARDDVTGGIWYWQAPAKFLGNISCAYGGVLSFDLRQSSTSSQFNANDIVLQGGGLTLIFNTPNNPGTAWTPYSIFLSELAGWRKTSLSGPAPTQAEMLAVLSSLEKLQIRGEYRSGVDRGDLDNVVVTCNPSLTTATVSGDATICSGSSATLNVELTGTAPWSLTWSDGFVQSDINSSPATRVVSPASTTTYTIANIGNTNGCSNIGYGSATITVNPLPTALVSGNAAICAGSSASISATLTGTAPWNLTWSDGFVQNNVASSPAIRTVSPASTTTYSVTSISDANCTGTSSGSATITVNPLPTAAVSGDATICAGSSTMLTATLTGIGPWNLMWSDGFVQNGVASSPATRSVNPGTTTTYTVTSVADANCTGTSSGSATITINPSPTATVSGSTSICAGSSTTLTATLTGTGPWNITWSDAVTQNGIVSSPATRIVNPASTTTYTVTSVSDANCTGTSSGSATVTINPSPTATVSGSTTICAGGSTTLSAVLTGTAPWNLTWSDGFTQPASSSPATRIVSPASTTIYAVTAVSDANCTGTSSGSATVTINPLPTATVSGDATICAGRSTTLSASLTGTGPWNLTWSDGVTQDEIANSPATRTVSPTITTVYTVTAVSDVNCTGTASGSATATVRASNPPVIGAIIVPVNPTLVNTSIDASASFTDAADNGDHSATWSWGDNSTSAGIVNEGAYTVIGSHTYTAAGVYTVTLTVTDGCDNSGEGTATEFVVIYDPSAGFVTGGGWIMSPAGAYVADPSLTGKANFGFVSKYQKGKTIPDGNTEFNFKAGSLNFHSTVYEWLVIAGPNAKYKGSGTINNSGNYGFMLTARDGQVNGGGGVDKFRIKIWDKNNGDAVVYDNQMNDPDDAEATDAIEGGSITIHSSGASKEAANASEPVPVSFMLEQNYPNPFNPNTVISFALPEAGRVTLKIYSEIGQLVATLVDGEMNVGHYAISWEGRNQSGHAVAAGVYLYHLVVKRQSGETAFVQTRRMAFVK